jgi:hypothetical protein
MERFVFSCGACAFIGLGFCLLVWPAWIARINRDEGEDHPVTESELWTMRLVGAAMLGLAGYGLYALLTGMPGGEFSPT